MGSENDVGRKRLQYPSFQSMITIVVLIPEILSLVALAICSLTIKIKEGAHLICPYIKYFEVNMVANKYTRNLQLLDYSNLVPKWI